MRVIGGQYRSRTLTAPRGVTTRPTLDQTREALFNILQGRTEGTAFLDLYAGSGAVALEAVSRGARRAVLVDRSRSACAAIRENIVRLGCGDRSRLLCMTDRQAIRLLAEENERFDLMYLDPPYALDTAPVLALLTEEGLLADAGLIIVEHAADSPPAAPAALTLARRKAYRGTALSFYEMARQGVDVKQM